MEKNTHVYLSQFDVQKKLIQYCKSAMENGMELLLKTKKKNYHKIQQFYSWMYTRDKIKSIKFFKK